MITFFELGKLGRLGNQLFQYAALRSLSLEKGYESKIPNPNTCEWHGQKCLLGEFNIQSPYLKEKDIQKIKFIYQEPDHMNYDVNFYNMPDDCNISGFFQSIYYFEKHQQKIKEELTPKKIHLDAAKKTLQDIKQKHPNHEIVSLHIRRGDNTDYTDPSQEALRRFYDKGGKFDQYTESATNLFEDKKIKFLVFTGGKRWTEDNNEDIEWCKDRLDNDKFIFSEKRSPMEDFCLIMSCDHHIISPASSFGWWAAYLGDNDNKKVVAPLKYHPDIENINYRSGFYPKKWILV